MYDVIIIGSGPAGLTAAIYTTRASLKTLIIAGSKWGGQLMLTTEVENFPGFPTGILGPELMQNMRTQAERFGAEIIESDFKSCDFSRSQSNVPAANGGQAQKPFTITAGESTYSSKSVILATGADTKWLDVPGEKERIGRGISSCAPCDAPFFRNKKVIVVGGGDSAMEEALVLTRFATHVYILYRGDTLKASKVMQERAFANEKITFVFNTIISEVMGEQKVEKVKLVTKYSDGLNIIDPEDLGGLTLTKEATVTTWEFPIDGIFVAIGHLPNSKVFEAIGPNLIGVETDEKGFIKIRDHMQTNIPGVFVAGDVHDSHYMQAITAAGFGCAAALEAEKYVSGQEALIDKAN